MRIVREQRLSAIIDELGSVLEVFPQKNAVLVKWGNAALAAACLSGGGYFLVNGILKAYENYYRHGPAVVPRTLAMPISTAALLILIGALAALAAYRYWNYFAVIYEEGLLVSNWRGAFGWRWDEVSSIRSDITYRVYTGVLGHTVHRYWLVGRDAEKAVLDDSIDQVERLAGMIRLRVIPHIFARYNNAFNTGQTLVFGPIRIHRNGGIEIGKLQYPWDQLKDVTVQKGFVQFTLWSGSDGSGASPRVAVAQIPNLDVLLSILDQIPGTLVKPDDETLVVPPAE